MSDKPSEDNVVDDKAEPDAKIVWPYLGAAK